MKDSWAQRWKAAWRIQKIASNGLVACEKDWCWDPPEFVDYDLWIALDGIGEMRIGEAIHEVSPGFAVCFPPGARAVHAQHDPDQPLRVFYCHFSATAPAGKPARVDPEPSLYRIALNSLLWNLIHAFSAPGEPAFPEAFREALLWQLLLNCEVSKAVQESSPEDRIQSVVRLVSENPGTAHAIDDLARQAGLSEGHFRRLFRHLTGESPVQFILRKRMQRAAFYLSETKLPVSAIAGILGYRDVYFFSRQFKERTGRSPREWRKGSETQVDVAGLPIDDE